MSMARALSVEPVAATTAAELSIVMLAGDGRGDLPSAMALREACARLGVSHQVILAGAARPIPDSDVGIARAAAPGYGAALAAGLAAATGQWVLTLDASEAAGAPAIVQALWRQRQEAEVLVAARHGRGAWWCAPARLLESFCRRALSLSVRDLSSHVRMYRRDVVASLTLASRGVEALAEILIRVEAEGWRIREVAVTGRAGGSVRLGLACLASLLRLWRLRNSVGAADYDHRAWDSPIWLQRYWQRARHRIVLEAVGERAPVLDVGCGSSRIIADLPRAIGLDIRQNTLRWLGRRHSRLVRATGARLPFADASLEAVIHSQVIEHLPDDPAILAECHRVLRPGGVLVLGTPDYARPLWWGLEWVHSRLMPGGHTREHVTRFTRRSLTDRLTCAGFEILACRYVGGCEMIFTARRL
jgi:hypothetical protein